jgi:tetratricopeptide (TPR) repeat protein
MSHTTDRSLAPLIEASGRVELVVFAGAGISMSPPSCLPDWRGFNHALLEEIKASALELAALSANAAAAIRRLDTEQLGVEALSDAIVQSFAGDSYFPLLEVLDSDQPNANHEAIAELARRGRCRAVVTTNFDTLLESAFHRAGLGCEVFEKPEDFRQSPKGDCPIYKIHGSVTASAGLVDTVSQKLRGLSFPVRARLIDLYQRNHILVLGFSGADLAFGVDYLALSALKSSGQGITWVVEPRSALNPHACAAIESVNGKRVEATLAEVFEALGAYATKPPLIPARDMNQSEVDARATARIRQWLSELGGGPLAAVHFCVELAEDLGWRKEANALRDALAADLQRRGSSLPLTAIVVFNNLASGAAWTGDYLKSERWALRALNMWAEFERRRRISVEPVSPAGMRQMTQQCISSWIQIGRARGGRGDIKGARQAFARARRAAEEIDDTNARAELLCNEAQLSRREGSSVEQQIDVTRRAWSLFVTTGFAKGMTECAVEEGYALATIGEYDAALAAVDRAQRTVHWSGSLLTRLAPDLLRAELAARRPQAAEAAEAFERAMARAANDPILVARIRLVAVAALVNHPSTRAKALTHVERVLAEMEEGRIPSDGSNQLASKEKARKIKTELERIAESAEPILATLPQGVADSERELRSLLLKAEHEGDAATVARVLRNLASKRYDAARPRRMLDLAQGAARAAERSGNLDDRYRALHLLAVACDLAGDFEGAMAASRELLDASPPASETLRIAASQTLAVVLAKVGRTAQAETLLRDIVAYRARQGDPAEETRSIIALADTLARSGNPAGARAVLQEGAAVIKHSGDRLALAKRDDMLVSMRQQEQGGRIPAPLLFADDNMRVSVTSAQLAQLRRKSESPHELCDLAAMALVSGHTQDAVDILLQAQTSFLQQSDTQGQARCFHLLADAAQLEWRWDSAIDFTRHALKLAEDMDDVPGQTSSYAAMALQSMAVDQLDRAAWAARQCLNLAGPADDTRFGTIAHCSLAEINWRTSRSKAALREIEVAREILHVATSLRPALRAWLEHRFARLPSRSTLGRWWRALLARLRPLARANR